MPTRRQQILSTLADYPLGVAGGVLVAGLDDREARLLRNLLIRLANEGVVTITRPARTNFASALIRQVRPWTDGRLTPKRPNARLPVGYPSSSVFL
jgi:hypothetical protein